MSLLDFPVRRHQFTVVAFTCIAALGAFAFMAMPREEDPHIKFGAAFIIGVYPGADPVELERLFVKPVEDKLAQLEDVRKMETGIADGVAAIGIEFEASSDADRKFEEVTREVNALRGQLPAEIRRIEVKRIDPAMVNIAQLALVSADAPYAEMEDRARELKDLLKTVPGVRDSEVWAFPSRELRVQLDRGRLAAAHIDATRVVQALQSGNANIPAGFIDAGSRSFSLQTSGSYKTLDEVRDTVVGAADGRVLRVRDVASVAWADQTLTYTGRYNGQRAVFITANQKDGFNIIDVQRGIDAAADQFRADLPARMRLERGFAQSGNVAKRLNNLYMDFGIAVAIVLLTLLPLGLRAAGIVMMSVPLSLAIGLTAVYFLGYSLNQITIAGFVLSLGLLVDDSIVVVENISRHMRMGLTRTQAALAGTRQIALAIIGCTATLVFAFLPLALLPGTPGKFIRVLPVTVMATVIGSVLVALLFIPFMASRVMGRGEQHNESRLLQSLMDAIHRYYRPALHYCLSRPRATVATSLGGAVVLSGLLALVLGSSLFPKADTPQFLISVETPNGSSFAATDEAVRKVEERLAKHPEVSGWFSNLGHGNPQVYYNQIVRNDAANLGEIFVQLNEYHAKATPRFIDGLRTEFASNAGAQVTVREFVQGTPITAPVSVRVLGPDLNKLRELSAQIQREIESVPGTRDVSNPLRVPRTNLRLAPDAQKAGLLGVPVVEFDRAVRLAVSGLPAGSYKSANGEQYDIVVRSAVGQRSGLETLDEIRVPSASGALLPLSQLATLQFEQAPNRIQRFSRQRSVIIDSQVAAGFNTAAVTANVVKQLDAFAWPRGYRYVLGGEAESSSEAFGGIGIASLVAVFGIFAILVLEFSNYRSTLIVLTVVPLGVVGGLLMLLVTGNDISFTAAIGFVALMGIEIKNSILLVDFTNQLRASGMALDDAIEQAGEVRFLPILLTSVTAIGGLLPLAVQNTGLYSPMAWVIIGGLITSTLLARLVTPVLYKLMPPDIDSETDATAHG